MGRKIVNFEFVYSPTSLDRPFIFSRPVIFQQQQFHPPVEYKIPAESLTLYNGCSTYNRDKAMFTDVNVQ